MRSRRWALLVLLLLLAGLVLASPRFLRAVGSWLVVEDPLAPAAAIFVHGGQLPFRAVEAAEIYHRGLAPEVWLAPIGPDATERALAELGIERPQGWFYNRQVLEKLGVPPAAVRLLERPVRNTRDELRLVADELRRTGGQRAILVTSKQHSRRVRLLWRKLAEPGLEAVVRPAAGDPFDPAAWWRNTDDGQAVLHELAGLVEAWLGYEIRPERPGEAAPSRSDPSLETAGS